LSDYINGSPNEAVRSILSYATLIDQPEDFKGDREQFFNTSRLREQLEMAGIKTSLIEEKISAPPELAKYRCLDLYL
jgi:hypothetical protein